ncbi:oligoendopeptidase F [Bacillus canaveralius]|uniref:Oligopeptidase F n=1 Tax=Bacillus canaveralius TaxID=1403243 RepID=A0A2N5GIP2_9BACI|nr:oligoendopeptidase F [Bacillus canaveralius]PLR80822.1 oligoendopeptidase F [Bacillus canaveralius]PLR98302.1 oligoendopeptidase F [Bacillus canaveralius]RSK52977.1 oligoendopeptidase F [Bacillus canaveralius]
MEKTVEKRLTRSEVPEKLTWNLQDLFVSNEAWENELNEINNALPSFEQFKGKLQQGANYLRDCLLAQENLSIRLVRVSTYASLRQSEDGSSPENQANFSKLSALVADVNAALSFIDSEILSFPDGLVESYLQEDKELQPFDRQLSELLEGKKHKLSAETEEVLASLGEVHGAPYRIYQTSKSADMEFSPVEDNEGNELPNSFALFEDRYEFSPDTAIRRKAYDSFVQTLQKYKNTFAATYATEVKKQVTLARLRNYESVTHMLLDPQKVSLDMYNNQLDIIQAELAPHMRRYAELKKQQLGLEKMLFCDLKAPLDPEFSPKTTYEEASKVILEALKVMGPEYSEIMEKGLTERWVDLADNVGKSTGAFCASPFGVHPYILITWTDTMRGAFVLAHELGHAGHFYLANKNQRIMNTRPSTYFVEAPSTMNELLLGDHLLKNTTDTRMRRWVALQLLGTYYHNFVTHLLEGEFQRRVYNLAENGTPLTAKVLCEQKADVLSSFWGDAVEIDEAASLTWMRQPHYYMGLYPYTYSAGLTASTAVSQLIQSEGQPAVDRWLDVLRAGGTKSPLDLLKHAGVDMSKPDAIRKAVSYVGTLVDELEKSYS